MYLITPNQLQTILLTHFSLLVRVWLRGYSECCWSRWHHLPEMYGFSETGTYRGNRETCQRSLFVTLRSGLPFMLVLHHLTIVMLKWLPFLYLVHVVGFVLVMLIIEKWLMWYPRLLLCFLLRWSCLRLAQLPSACTCLTENAEFGPAIQIFSLAG